MSHDIFISHSTQDRDIATRMCAELEKSGLSCWIAPRDISGGEAWDEAITSGLERCRLVLLVFSQVSNESPHVKREILMAMDKKKYLLPVRIENIQPGRQLEYLLAGIQWFDARSPFSIRCMESNISYSSFFGKDLKKASFINCTATETDFTDCNLTEAVFTGTSRSRCGRPQANSSV